MSQEDTKDSVQSLQNRSFDPVNNLNMVEPVQFDGTTFRKDQSNLVAQKITTIGDDTYIAVAPIGTDQVSAKWQVKKVSVSGSDTVITWADGDASFDNVATDLTSLNYL